jgi:hypothetical protein
MASSRQKYLEDREKKSRVKVTSVACPICGAKRGDVCVFVNTGRRRARPHPERRKKARAVFRARQRRMRTVRALREQRWASVTVRYECPLCGGDHSCADHARAANTLLNRTRGSGP